MPQLQIKTSANSILMADLFLPAKGNSFPVFIFCHGFKGFKDWGFFPLMHQWFNQAGIAVLTFNFSKNGTSAKSPAEFTDLDAFASNTVSLEVSEIKNVVDWVVNHAAEFSIDSERIFLGGHSRGAAEAIVYAGTDKRVKKVVSWAPVSDFAALFSSFDLNAWKENGTVTIKNARTGQDMPLNFTLWEDIDNNVSLDILKAAEFLESDLLLIHGTHDVSVPMKHASEIYNACAHSILISIENADHTFNARHPWPASEPLPEATMDVINNTIAFLED
jgi:dipeptidyl aminopeptidase/acylaminoacyl peptidase